MGSRTRVVVLVGLLLLASAGTLLGARAKPKAPAKAKPASPPSLIPATAASYTCRQFRADLLAFTERTLVAPYDQVGDRDPAWDEAARRYLKANARAFSFQPDAPTKARLVADGKALQDLGCTDPMVAYCYGAALQDSGQVAEAAVALRRAVEGFRKAAYPRARAFYAPTRLSQLLGATGEDADEKEADRLRMLACKWIGEAGGEIRDSGREPHCFLTTVSGAWDTLTQDNTDAVSSQVKANPKMPAYVTDVTGGWAELDEAWKVRGQGWAGRVPEQAWEGFYSHLDTASRLLTRAWKAHPEYPEAPASMIRVAMLQSSNEVARQERVWFTRATKAQLDYEAAYRNLMWALRPRWGGSYEEMKALGLAALKTGRFDTIVPRFYAVAMFDIRQDQEQMEEPADALSRPGVYANLKRICEGYIAAAENDWQRTYYRTFLAECAWLTGHEADARAAFEALGDTADPQVFLDWRAELTLAGVRAQVFARTGAAAAEVKQAEGLLADGQWEQVPPLCAKALAAEQNPYAVEYLRYLQGEAEQHLQLARGEWASLRPGPALLGWEPDRGTWEVELDGALRGTTGPGGLYLYKLKGFGPRIELEGEVEFVTLPDTDSGQVALMLGYTNHRDGYEYAGVRISPGYGGVMVEHGTDHTRQHIAPAQIGKKAAFRVLLWDGELTVYLDGKLIHRAVRITDTPASSDAGLVFGSHHPGPGASYRFRNLRVRRLQEKPQFAE